MRTAQTNLERNSEAWSKVSKAFQFPLQAEHWAAYLTDSAQRAVLFADAMRQRGNHFNDHEQGSNQTVLSWKHDLVIDGTKLARPVNYSLGRIVAPEGIRVRENGRLYIIIDPRAGHGSGIGGFKHESEVGAAIHQGHPVYFVTFTRLVHAFLNLEVLVPDACGDLYRRIGAFLAGTPGTANGS